MVNSLKGDGKAIFTVFVGLIITVVFLAGFATTLVPQTTTESETNLSVTVSAINVSLAVAGRDLIAVTDINNLTDAGLESQGLNLGDGLVSGLKTVTLTANDTATDFVGTTVNLTYSYNPDGFISIAGGRSIALLITIVSALAMVVFVVVVLIKEGSLGALINNATRRRK